MKKWLLVVVGLILLGAIIKSSQPPSHPPQLPPQPAPPSLVGVCRHGGVNGYFYEKDIHVWHIVCNNGTTTDLR